MATKEKFEEAKRLYETANADQRYVLESLFPELKGSEDERIKQELIEYFQWAPMQYLNDFNNKRVVAWLEKQEQKEYGWSEESDDDAWLNDIVSKVESDLQLNKAEINWLKSIKEKLHKEVHYWTEEEIEPIISDYLRGTEHYGGMIGRLRCLKPKSLERQGEQEAWSEEDKKMLKWVTGYLENKMLNAPMGEERTACKNAIAWFKKLEGEQKPVDTVEPQFHEGEWVFIEEIEGHKQGPFQIKSVDEFGYNFDEYHTIPFIYEELLSKWTIEDAKDGDVLAVDPWSDYPSSFVAIYKKQNEEDFDDFDSYCFVGFDGKFYENEDGHSSEDIHLATKEQRDLLFQKMKEAGYEWDAEKKELKKIEQKPAGWSEEDETVLNNLIYALANDRIGNNSDEYVEYLKSLKDRVQPKQEWSEEDKRKIDRIYSLLIQAADTHAFSTSCRLIGDKECIELQDFLKSIALQNTWKPSDEQMDALLVKIPIENSCNKVDNILKSLYSDLKKLK